jgi:hypothetical protein
MTDWSTAEAWLERTKAANRSSPAGYAWHQFWQWLGRASPRATSKPPMPSDHGILAEAIAWLDGCPPDKWETHDPKRWSESFYPTFDDVTDDEGDDTN